MMEVPVALLPTPMNGPDEPENPIADWLCIPVALPSPDEPPNPDELPDPDELPNAPAEPLASVEPVAPGAPAEPFAPLAPNAPLEPNALLDPCRSGDAVRLKSRGCSQASGCDSSQRLAKEALYRGLVLPHPDQPIVRLASERVHIPLTQKADVVGVFQLFDGGGIAAKFLVVQLDRSHVLVGPAHRLHFALAAQVEGLLRRGHAQRNQDQRDSHDQSQQDEALLAAGLRRRRLGSRTLNLG